MQSECTRPVQSLAAELVQLYFDYVHDQFHTLFHQPSFMEDLENGKAHPILVYGMMALSARSVSDHTATKHVLTLVRFSKNSIFADVDPRERGARYAEQCKQLLDWNDVSVTTIQACVLLGAFAITEGNPASESIYYAVACRIAQLLDLPNHQAPSRVEQEVNIRSSSGTITPTRIPANVF